METKETEVRFLEIDKDALVKKLVSLGAEDKGEVMLEEVIIYDKDGRWKKEKRFLRIRKSGDTTKLTYKQHSENPQDGATEIEFKVEDIDKPIALLEKLGFMPFRRQQKKRHTLELDGVTFDIDTWPRIPTYVELEGLTMEALQTAAKKADLDWSKVVYEDARDIIEKIYKIPVGDMTWFTFSRFE